MKSLELNNNISNIDEWLVKQLADGNVAALRLLVDKYGEKIYHTAYGVTHSHQESEEVMQDVLITIYRKAHTLRNTLALSGWIRRITVNYARMKLRNTKRSRDLLDKMGVKGIDISSGINNCKSENAMSFVLDEEAKAVLVKAISALPPKYKSVILLNDLKNFSLRKTSDILNISIPAVKSRLHRARKQLKNQLDCYFIDHAN
ncbi:MAG: RNA polymerase sigma factor [Vampirovibrionia bacterium]